MLNLSHFIDYCFFKSLKLIAVMIVKENNKDTI